MDNISQQIEKTNHQLVAPTVDDKKNELVLTDDELESVGVFFDILTDILDGGLSEQTEQKVSSVCRKIRRKERSKVGLEQFSAQAR